MTASATYVTPLGEGSSLAATLVGLGGSYDFVFVPSTLNTAYGSDPHGAMIFTRVAAE